ALLLGLGRAPGAPRWLALSGRGDRAVGLAFGGFDAYERVPAAAIEAAAPGGQGEAGRGHVTELVRVAGVLRSVIGLDGLVAALRARSARGDEEEG
ncbi:MAG: hypothetical protein KC635_18225, partial [Myxococcales bacterium]|nr:hypothetical protein [Myxococcales bacterium]